MVGYGTDRFPEFYLADSGLPRAWRVDTPEDVAGVSRAREPLGLEDGVLVVANPIGADEQLDPDLHARARRRAGGAAEREAVRGRDVTPFLLDRFHRDTAGASLAVNVRLVLRQREAGRGIEVAVAA